MVELDCAPITPITIRGALRDLLLSVQFKKLENPSWSSATFSKVAEWRMQLY